MSRASAGAADREGDLSYHQRVARTGVATLLIEQNARAALQILGLRLRAGDGRVCAGRAGGGTRAESTCDRNLPRVSEENGLIGGAVVGNGRRVSRETRRFCFGWRSDSHASAVNNQGISTGGTIKSSSSGGGEVSQAQMAIRFVDRGWLPLVPQNDDVPDHRDKCRAYRRKFVRTGAQGVSPRRWAGTGLERLYVPREISAHGSLHRRNDVRRRAGLFAGVGAEPQIHRSNAEKSSKCTDPTIRTAFG